jgi:hypothetical protein
MKDFVYLVQGQAELVRNYFPLRQRADVDVLLLTYDREIDEAIFLPQSSWA